MSVLAVAAGFATALAVWAGLSVLLVGGWIALVESARRRHPPQRPPRDDEGHCFTCGVDFDSADIHVDLWHAKRASAMEDDPAWPNIERNLP